MSVLPFSPNTEQQHILELLFVNHPEHVALGLTLLEQRSDKAFFVRPLALISRASDEYHACQKVDAFLEYYCSETWKAVHAELDIFEDAMDANGNLLSRAQLKERFDRYQPHAPAYEYCIGLNHSFTRLYEHFIDDLREFGLIEDAQRCLKQLQQLFPEEPAYFYEYAVLLGNDTDTQAEQLAYLTHAATAAKTQPEYLNRLAQYYDEILDDATTSLLWLQRSLALDEAEPFTHFLLAEHHAHKDALPKANDHYHRAASLAQDDGFYAGHYAWFLLQTRRYDDALEWATQAVALQANVHRFDQPLAFHSCLAAVYWYGYQDQEQAQHLLSEMANHHFNDPMGERLAADIQSGNHQLTVL